MSDLRAVEGLFENRTHAYPETQAVLALASVLLEVSSILHGPCDRNTREAMHELEHIILQRLEVLASAADDS